LCLPLVLSTIIAATTFTSKATIFFSDNFTNGSTINSVTPANPTPTNTAYEVISSKSQTPAPSVAANDLKFSIAATTSGSFEEQALFATNAIPLTQPGDNIQLMIVFTNTLGVLAQSGALGMGLYNSGQVKPIPGGTNAATTSINITGFAQNWAGYVGQVNYGAANCRIMTRPTQSATTGINQDLVTSGSGSSSYSGAANVGPNVVGNVALNAGSNLTEVLTITMIDANNLAVTNTLYGGTGTGGVLITNFGGVATGSTLVASGFDGLAIGYRATANTTANTFDISSIQVSGSVTVITDPPHIDIQPVDASVPTGGSCAFNIAATGFGVTYQWRRHGTNLLNAGNISGATSTQLIITNASAADFLSGANGYYCVVSGAGGFSTNSTTNMLSIVTAKNLVWDGTGSVWDLNNSPSWATGQTFNYGDSVTFDDTGAASVLVTLTGNFLSASTWTVTGNTAYAFSGTGSFAGSGRLIYNSTQPSQFNVANTHTGGTTINSAATVTLFQYQSLGNGPVTLAGGGKLEITPTPGGSATVGINGDVNVTDDFTIQFDPSGSFAGVFLGNISGTAGKTLTVTPLTTTAANRYRAFGGNTTCNANLNLADASVVFASYQTTGLQTYNGIISGSGAFMEKGTTTIFNGVNTYTGGTTPAAGFIGFGCDSQGSPGSLTGGPIGTGPLLLAVDSTSTTSGSGGVLASGGARVIGNAIQYPSATNNLTLIIGGTNNLTFTGAYALNGQDGQGAGTNRTIQVTNTAATSISSGITDGGLGCGLIKTGTGTLYLNGGNTFSGPTTISAGVLAGSGSLAGSAVVSTNGGSIGGGSAAGIGTLSVSGSLTFTNNGGGFFRVNRAGLVSDVVSVGGTITNTGSGTITVNNLGSTLQVGDSFTLFNKGVSNGAAMTVIGGGVAWGNNLAANGSIVVVAPPDTGVQLAAPAGVLLGANITNTVTVTNVGPGTAFNLVITDAVPANVTFVSANSGGTTNGHLGVVVWNLPNLAPNTSTNFTLVFKASTVGNVTNIATVASSSIDTSPANNGATNITAVTSVIIPGVPPYIGSFSLAGGNVVINGTNGVTGGTYYLLGTTNIAKPLVQWTPVATNVVNTNGASNNGFSFTGTNVVTPGVGQQFYILSNTNNR